jgi:ABC-2 type transport system permease protein
MNVTVLGAIFRRDFISYFSNPTGYVFICVFVMLCSLAAFWPPDFFNNNLANLDQLSRWMPFILLVFVPAITMSTWAEERRQGTDELLLTMPATDFDVVLGKYLAALAIYTVSLLFGMFSIYLVFAYGLGQPDWGLFACTFLGYWLVGGALLSIGMVASFLTRNLTVGFVLGMLFIAPFALAGVADWIVKEPGTAQLISRWSVANQFSDFARGVVSLSGVSYFIILTVVMLYLCMVLIGRRHWGTGEEGDSRWAHYFGRFAALLLIAGGLNVILSNYDQRADATQERINSLSDRTRQMMKSLADDDDVKPINVEVFVSPKVPSEYASHKLDLLGTLREIQSLTDGKVQAKIYQIENFSPEAQTAEQSYGIQPQLVNAMVRGRPAREEIMMGMAITSGLDKVVVPFVDKGIPPEYELVRSIMTVAETKRKRVGVLTTGVNLFEEFSMQGQVPQSQLITELEKQYDVVQVDPREPIVDSYDVLLAVQPSQLTPEALTNFLDYIKRGQPVAIFEDPAPTPLMPGAVATGAPNGAA